MHKKPLDMIEMARAIRPNELDDGLYFLWMVTIEMRVLFEVFGVEDPNEIEGNDLVVGPPHDDIYWTYLVSMIDFATGNFESYAHSKALADKAWNNFVKHYHCKGGCTAPTYFGGEDR